MFVCACVRFFPSTLLVKVGGGSNQTSLAGLFSSFFLYSTHPRHTHSPTFVFATPHSLTPAGLADHLHTAIQKDTYSNYKPLVLAISWHPTRQKKHLKLEITPVLLWVYICDAPEITVYHLFFSFQLTRKDWQIHTNTQQPTDRVELINTLPYTHW